MTWLSLFWVNTVLLLGIMMVMVSATTAPLLRPSTPRHNSRRSTADTAAAATPPIPAAIGLPPRCATTSRHLRRCPVRQLGAADKTLPPATVAITTGGGSRSSSSGGRSRLHVPRQLLRLPK